MRRVLPSGSGLRSFAAEGIAVPGPPWRGEGCWPRLTGLARSHLADTAGPVGAWEASHNPSRGLGRGQERLNFEQDRAGDFFTDPDGGGKRCGGGWWGLEVGGAAGEIIPLACGQIRRSGPLYLV
jgi:hypothetical protein